MVLENRSGLPDLTDMAIATVFDALQGHIHRTAHNKGFYAGYEGLAKFLRDNGAPDEIYDEFRRRDALSRLMLVVTEVAEAAEEVRKPTTHDFLGRELYPLEPFAEELADIVIRVFDLAALQRVDLGEALIQKLEKNAKREYMHGGKTA